MKALSIKQPWAWLICTGYKDIENRNWRIGRNPRHGQYSSRDIDNFSIKLPERVYVHAGKQSDLTQETLDFIHKVMTVPLTHEYGSTWKDVLNFGALIGEVDIVDCVTESDSPWFVGKYGFVLANPLLYPKPIPCRGYLGFFDVDTEDLNVKLVPIQWHGHSQLESKGVMGIAQKRLIDFAIKLKLSRDNCG